jgi:hypothetical protein
LTEKQLRRAQSHKKNGSEKIRSHFSKMFSFASRGETKVAGGETKFQQRSEADVWNVAVADGDVGIGQKQAIDTGQEAAKQGAHGRQCDNGSLGHLLSPVAGTRWPSRRLRKM